MALLVMKYPCFFAGVVGAEAEVVIIVVVVVVVRAVVGLREGEVKLLVVVVVVVVVLDLVRPGSRDVKARMSLAVSSARPPRPT